MKWQIVVGETLLLYKARTIMNINFVFIYIDSIILNIKCFNKLISFCVDKNITCYCKSCYMRFVMDIYTTNNACTMEQENDNYFCIFNERMAPELNIPSNICYYNNGCSLHLSLSLSLSHISIKFPFSNTHTHQSTFLPHLKEKTHKHPNHVLNWVVSIFATLHSNPLFSNTCHPKPTKIPAHFQAFTAQFLQHDGCNDFYNQLWIQELDSDFHSGCAESRE